MTRSLMRDRVFGAGLLSRCLAILLALPFWTSSPVAAFLGEMGRGGHSPWADWMLSGGHADVFGYGLPSLLAFAPGALLGQVFGLPWLGLALTVLALDVAIYALLVHVTGDERRREVLRLYWLSPAVIFLVYWMDGLAVLPAALLLGMFHYIEDRRFGLAGAVLGLAIAAEPVLASLAPVAILYAVSLGRVRDGARRFLIAAGACAIVPTLLFLPDMFFRAMVMRSSALRDVLALYLPSSDAAGVAIQPMVIAALAYLGWRARFLNADLLWTFIGLTLLAMGTLGGPSAAVAPIMLLFLTVHSVYAERMGRVLFHLLSGLVVIWHALVLPSPFSATGLLGDLDAFPILLGLRTLICALGMVIGLQMLRRRLFRTSSYLATRRPVAIGIAGDSGVGKDTLVDGIGAMFEDRVVVGVSGDDYHHWDRNKPMWRALTHLNPKANDLGLFVAHMTALIDRRWVMARHYDHAKGRMTKPLLIRPGELILASGLHALWSPTLNSLYDLRVFLEMDEDLRRFLKIRRDVHQRGQPMERVLASINRRKADTQAFIIPQRDNADLVFTLEPRDRNVLEDARAVDEIPLRLSVRAIPGMTFDALVRVVVARCGVQAVELPLHAGGARLIVEGEPDAEDIAAAARALAPNVQELMRDAPGWQPGLRGVMQLVILDQLEQIRHRRSLNA